MTTCPHLVTYSCCDKLFDNRKSYSNHKRWHNPGFGKQIREQMSLRWQNPEYSERVKRQISLKNKGEKNGMWRGDNVRYRALHNYVELRLTKPTKCSLCDKETRFLDLANISQKYKRDLSDWEWLCRKCHMIKDERMQLIRTQHTRQTIIRGANGRIVGIKKMS